MAKSLHIMLIGKEPNYSTKSGFILIRSVDGRCSARYFLHYCQGVFDTAQQNTTKESGMIRQETTHISIIRKILRE